jgi:molybdopterin-binding protein
MRISARNQFKGIVKSVTEGAVNGIVTIDIGGGNVMSATISMAAIRELGLKPGVPATAIVKATSVMVGVD